MLSRFSNDDLASAETFILFIFQGRKGRAEEAANGKDKKRKSLHIYTHLS